ncbi:hypothetical protein GYW21_10485 [Lactobacillus mellis]|nr:hypothetical protein [Bombilactobacillus mellis]
MSELTDLVANLEQKYGSPLRDIPYNDPDFITIQKKYWPDNNQHKHPKHKKYREGTKCKVIELKTGKEHIFQSFYQASKFYGYSQGWARKYYVIQKKGHNNPKYKIVKLEKD